jgi:hypothetical protein
MMALVEASILFTIVSLVVLVFAVVARELDRRSDARRD